MNLLIIFFGRLLSSISRLLQLGNGSTWPGHIALTLNKNFISDLLNKSKVKIILVAGTNGKTTTSLLLKTILETNGKKVILNNSGANLFNGIASILLLNTNLVGRIKADFAIFEVDENAFPLLLKHIEPEYIIELNLFRDQLDRYGEVRSVANKWRAATKLKEKTVFILNADDPEIGFADGIVKKKFFGLANEKEVKNNEDHLSDSLYCPSCGAKLQYKKRYYSHLGDWYCTNCSLTRPELAVSSFEFYPLKGTYNKYNTLAAVLTAREIGLSDTEIKEGLQHFEPAFGRQEVLEYKKKKVEILLAKNPTGFNESLRTSKELGAKTFLIVLNDRIADGTDVSWIWDVDFEICSNFAKKIVISGNRAYDLGVRMKYTLDNPLKFTDVFEIEPDMQRAVDLAATSLDEHETLFILPTYTAMLDIRKIITGKKIL